MNLNMILNLVFSKLTNLNLFFLGNEFEFRFFKINKFEFEFSFFKVNEYEFEFKN